LLAAIAVSFGVSQPGLACTLSEAQKGTVAQVIDGETLALTDGSVVRLIGAQDPRSSAWMAGRAPVAQSRGRTTGPLAQRWPGCVCGCGAGSSGGTARWFTRPIPSRLSSCRRP